MFSLSGKVNSQIPCFPCAVATLPIFQFINLIIFSYFWVKFPHLSNWNIVYQFPVFSVPSGNPNNIYSNIQVHVHMFNKIITVMFISCKFQLQVHTTFTNDSGTRGRPITLAMNNFPFNIFQCECFISLKKHYPNSYWGVHVTTNI